MITFIRTASPLPGKTLDLMAFAKDIARAVKKANGVDLTVSGAVGATVGAVAWISTYKSLGEMEEKASKLMLDADYIAMLKKAEGLIVPGSARDQIWRQI